MVLVQCNLCVNKYLHYYFLKIKSDKVRHKIFYAFYAFNMSYKLSIKLILHSNTSFENRIYIL